MTNRYLFVDGSNRASEQTFSVINPLTGQCAWEWPSATKEDCDDAIRGVSNGQDSWENTSPTARRDIFLKAADLVTTEKYSNTIKHCMSMETAASPEWCHVNITATVNGLREAASLATQVRGQTLQSENSYCEIFLVQRRAAGVVFAIAPWNAPVNLCVRAIAVPLICGNTVIVKASEYSPSSQRVVVDILLEAGLPASAISFLTFTRATAPALTERIISDNRVNRVNFTGSDTVGRVIAQTCGKYLKQCVLELGGKAPVVVLNDAELDDAARAIIYASMIHSGQVCMSTERVICQKDVAFELEKRLLFHASKLSAGDTHEQPRSHSLGPLFTPGSASDVLGHINESVSKGANLVMGTYPVKAQGEYSTIVQPHIVSGVKNDMEIWKRESFGPVISVTSVESEDQAVDAANDSPYSLMAALWTKDVQKAIQLAKRLRAGSVQVNASTISVEPGVSNGGIGGSSGFGRFSIPYFTDERIIAFHAANGKYPLTG